MANHPKSINTSINIIINGAHGKMGKEAVLAISNEPGLKLVAMLGKNDDLADAINKLNAEVVLDLTNAASVFNNTKTIINNHACPVIGSSGLLEQEIHELQELAKLHKVGGIIVPNFSLGAVLMMKFSAIAAQYYTQAEIIERHHPDKLDAPSGTAIRTAEIIAKNSKSTELHPHNYKSKQVIANALGANYKNIPIHSIRLNGSCAHQSVIFGGFEETLTITHDSNSRKSFMPGVILSCQKAKFLPDLCVGLENLLDI